MFSAKERSSNKINEGNGKHRKVQQTNKNQAKQKEYLHEQHAKETWNTCTERINTDTCAKSISYNTLHEIEE